MRHLFKEFVSDIHKEAEGKSQERDENVGLAQDVKIPALQLFDELGRLFDKELKNRITNSKKTSTKQQTIEQHLLIDDHSIGTMDRNMQLKVGAFLANLMCKNLKYKIGN